MKVFVTKYVATRGIIECEVEDCGYDGMVKDRKWISTYYHRGEWFKTEAGALNDAIEKLRRVEDAALRKAARARHAVVDYAKQLDAIAGHSRGRPPRE